MLDAISITVIIAFVIFLILILYKTKDKVSIRGNHDHLKKCHTTIESAQKEIKRMRDKKTIGSERLQYYWSESRKCWLIGKSSINKK